LELTAFLAQRLIEEAEQRIRWVHVVVFMKSPSVLVVKTAPAPEAPGP